MKTSTKLATAAVALMGVLSAGSLLLAAGLPTVQESQLVGAIREQVDLLKWVGGAMVTGLVAAVGWLWSALKMEQAEAKIMYTKSSEADDRLAQAVEKLTAHLNDRPCLLKKEEK